MITKCFYAIALGVLLYKRDMYFALFFPYLIIIPLLLFFCYWLKESAPYRCRKTDEAVEQSEADEILCGTPLFPNYSNKFPLEEWRTSVWGWDYMVYGEFRIHNPFRDNYAVKEDIPADAVNSPCKWFIRISGTNESVYSGETCTIRLETPASELDYWRRGCLLSYNHTPESTGMLLNEIIKFFLATNLEEWDDELTPWEMMYKNGKSYGIQGKFTHYTASGTIKRAACSQRKTKVHSLPGTERYRRLSFCLSKDDDRNDYFVIPASQVSLKYDDDVPYSLGEGGFGQAFLGDWKVGRKKYAVAVKRYHNGFSGLNMTDAHHILKAEANLMSQLDHKNIVKCYGCISEPDCFSLVIGIWKTDLRQVIAGRSCFTSDAISYEESHIISWINQILQGLEYLHGKGYLHRDLKPENVLIRHIGQTGFLYDSTVALSDFGCANEVHEWRCTAVGTAAYAAPEVWVSGPQTEKVDVFSTSLIYYDLLARKPRTRLLEFTVQGDRPDLFENHEEAMNFIERGWQGDPSLRPTVSEFLVYIRHLGKSYPAAEELSSDLLRDISAAEALQSDKKVPFPKSIYELYATDIEGPKVVVFIAIAYTAMVFAVIYCYGDKAGSNVIEYTHYWLRHTSKLRTPAYHLISLFGFIMYLEAGNHILLLLVASFSSHGYAFITVYDEFGIAYAHRLSLPGLWFHLDRFLKKWPGLRTTIPHEHMYDRTDYMEPPIFQTLSRVVPLVWHTAAMAGMMDILVTSITSKGDDDWGTLFIGPAWILAVIQPFALWMLFPERILQHPYFKAVLNFFA